MTFKEAAYRVLQEEQKPLTADEITEIALSKGMLNTEGETPESTMAAQLYTDIKNKGEDSSFTKAGRGLFGLQEWDDDVYEEESSGFPEISSIIKNLEERHTKSSSPREFEESLKNAFVFLGFEGELIGGSGDTDVLLAANIGNQTFKVNVDGKTSKTGKINDAQIDWTSLEDHKEKNKADFVVIVGPDFAQGNLRERAQKKDVVLLKTKELIRLIKAHKKFPFTLVEFKDLFTGNGDIDPQLEDLITQNQNRVILLEQFRVIIEEMQSIQDRLGYFTFDGLASRESINELEIELDDIRYIIDLLKLPFINGIEKTPDEKYILTLKTKDIANIFKQISNLLIEPSEKEDLEQSPISESEEEEEQLGSNYFDWHIKGHSVVAQARKDDPYDHYCPIKHFRAIVNEILKLFDEVNVLGAKEVHESLEGKNLTDNRPYKGKAETYKIRVCLGVLEIEDFLKWTGSKKPIEYKLNKPVDEVENWLDKHIQEKN